EAVASNFQRGRGVFAELDLINIDMNDVSSLLKFRGCSGHSFSESAAKRDQQIALLVGPHCASTSDGAEHAHRVWMGIGNRTFGGHGGGDGQIQRFCELDDGIARMIWNASASEEN